VHIRPRLLAPLVAIGLIAAGCSSSSSSSADAAKLITKTQKAVQKASSVHFVDVTRVGKGTETLTGDIASSEAQEVLVVNSQVALQVRLVSGTVYLQTSATNVLQNSLGMTADEATASTGKWISLGSSDAPTSGIISSLSINQALGIYYPKSSAATILPTKTIAKVTVIPITSNSTPATKTTESTTLYVNAANSLPAAATLTAKQGSTTEIKQAAFNHWGEPISVTAPTGAVSYASIVG
jgi:hypothetical protein